MPGLNKQGPEGMGAMTGRQKGICRRPEKRALPNDENIQGRGRGYGIGRGQGRGMGQGRRSTGDIGNESKRGVEESNELRLLKEQYLAAQRRIGTLEEKIAALTTGKEMSPEITGR